MATANELLSMAAQEDRVFVIDVDRREIIIPSTVPNLGVTSDDDVNVVPFKMPATYCNADLSKFEFRINYLNASGEPDVYDVNDVSIEDGIVTFSWLVGRHAAKYKGDVKFSVCCKEVDATSGKVLREFNTAVASRPILEGLETGEQAIAEYNDIFEQWKAQLFGAGDSAVNKIEAAMNSALDKIPTSVDLEDLNAAVFELEEVPPSANLWNPDTATYDVINVNEMGYYVTIPCTEADTYWVMHNNDGTIGRGDDLSITLVGANGKKASFGANQHYTRAISWFREYYADNADLAAIDEIVAINIGVRENQIPNGDPANVMVAFSDTKPTEFVEYYAGGVVKHSRIVPLQDQVDELSKRVTDLEDNASDDTQIVELSGRVTDVEKAVEENAAAVEEQLAEMQEKVDTAGSGRVKLWNTPIEEKCAQFTHLLHGRDKVESFLFFTDPHLGTLGLNYDDLTHQYVDPVKVYYDATPTSFVLNGGDTCHENTADVEGVAYRLAFVDGYMRKSFDRYYPTVGNHDDNYANDHDSPDIFSASTIRNLMLRQEDGLYYSFAGVNSRGYVLNATDNKNARSNGDLQMTDYRWEQVAWLAQRLKEDDADNSFLLYHQGYTRRDGYPNGRDLSGLSKEVLKLAEAYNNGTSITLNGATYDFAGCTGCVRFILSGHIHDANCAETHNGIPVITTYDMRKLSGKPTFDLCLADFDAEVLHMRRVGAGADRDIPMGSRTFKGNTYSVTMNLTDVNASNPAVLIREGVAYENALTVPFGYVRDSVAVTMGGEDITATAYSGGQIAIGSVTGDITITATAIEPNYTNLADPTSEDWYSYACLDGSGTVVTASSVDPNGTVTNFIPITEGDVLRFKGFDQNVNYVPGSGQSSKLVYYDENKVRVTHQSLYIDAMGKSHGLPTSAVADENGVITHTMIIRGDTNEQYTLGNVSTLAKYVRIAAMRTVPVDEIIITINEEIQ